jgi:hypothetical protein
MIIDFRSKKTPQVSEHFWNDAPLPFTKTLHLILRWTYEILREHFRMLFRKMGRLKVELWVFWKFWEEAVQ